jgi:transposase
MTDEMYSEERCPNCGQDIYDIVYMECCGKYMCEECKEKHDKQWGIKDEDEDED